MSCSNNLRAIFAMLRTYPALLLVLLCAEYTVEFVRAEQGSTGEDVSLSEMGHESAQQKIEVREVAQKAFQDVKLQRDQDRRAARHTAQARYDKQVYLGEELAHSRAVQDSRAAGHAERKSKQDRNVAEANDKEAWEVSKKVFKSTQHEVQMDQAKKLTQNPSQRARASLGNGGNKGKTRNVVEALFVALLQSDEDATAAAHPTSTQGKLSALLTKKEQLLAKVTALHKHMEAKSAPLNQKLAAAEKLASTAAKEKEAAVAQTDREKFIKAEIEKARTAASMKIVNPLEAKLSQAKQAFDREHAWVAHDRKNVIHHLKQANEAVAAGRTANVSEHDNEASKSAALLRYSSKHSSEVESVYLSVKHEYDALQARLEQENKKQMDKAAEQAEEKAGHAYDKVEGGRKQQVGRAAVPR